MVLASTTKYYSQVLSLLVMASTVRYHNYIYDKYLEANFEPVNSNLMSYSGLK